MNLDQAKRSGGGSRAFVVALLLTSITLVGASASAQNAGGINAFSFNSDEFSGFPSGGVLLTGGGALNL